MAAGERRREIMDPRIRYAQVAPKAIEALYAIEKYVRNRGLEPSLLELVKMRASQINGCAYCIDMHSKDARAEGETEQRLYGLTAWREAPYYSERERSVLAWTESVTEISKDHAPDDVYDELRRHLSEEEIIDLTMAIIAINGWNRLAISFRTVPGTYHREPK